MLAIVSITPFAVAIPLYQTSEAPVVVIALIVSSTLVSRPLIFLPAVNSPDVTLIFQVLASDADVAIPVAPAVEITTESIVSVA